MLSLPVLALAGTFAALVGATPPALPLPDSAHPECAPALDTVAGCLHSRSSTPLPIAGDGRLQFYKDTATCKAETCCKDGKALNVYDSCAVCKNVDCASDKPTDVANPPQPSAPSIKKIRQVANRCQLCAATYLNWKNQGLCNTAMEKMCSTYCRGECDFDCACRIWERPDSIHSCVVLAGKECVFSKNALA